MLLLNILWDDWPIFMISGSNEQLRQELEFTLLKVWLSQLVNFKNAIWTWRHLEERYAIRFYLNFGKNATETYGMLQTALSTILHELSLSFLSGIRDSRKAGSLWGMMRGVGRSKEVNTPELIDQRVRVGRVTKLSFYREFRKRFRRKRPALCQIGSVAFPPGQCASPQLHPCHRLFGQDGYRGQFTPPYSPDLDPCDFWSFPKLGG